MDGVLEALAEWEYENLQPGPEMTDVLCARGYITRLDVTNNQSPGHGKEYIAGELTDEGKDALRQAGLKPNRK